MLKRLFDFLCSLMALLLFTPFFIILAILIKFDSRGPVFYIQKRVGKEVCDFNLIKFRTMRPDSDKLGLLTVGNNDQRITKIGAFLRKYKLDELPQLINILKGDMSFVGPRPEVRKYVNLYTQEQKQILKVRPGLTDPASIHFIQENDLLAQASNPEQYYIQEILPQKTALNLKYIKEQSFLKDFSLIFTTFMAIFK